MTYMHVVEFALEVHSRTAPCGCRGAQDGCGKVHNIHDTCLLGCQVAQFMPQYCLGQAENNLRSPIGSLMQASKHRFGFEADAVSRRRPVAEACCASSQTSNDGVIFTSNASQETR